MPGSWAGKLTIIKSIFPEMKFQCNFSQNNREDDKLIQSSCDNTKNAKFSKIMLK